MAAGLGKGAGPAAVAAFRLSFCLPRLLPLHRRSRSRSRIGQALVGIVGTKQKPVFGARGKHPVRLRRTAGDQVIDHYAGISFGPGQAELVLFPQLSPAARMAALIPAIRPCAAASS